MITMHTAVVFLNCFVDLLVPHSSTAARGMHAQVNCIDGVEQCGLLVATSPVDTPSTTSTRPTVASGLGCELVSEHQKLIGKEHIYQIP